jgi:sugar phosphate permease
MWVPACIALAVSAVILFTITDKPADKGYPPAEASVNKPASLEGDGKANGKSESEGEPTVKDILFKDVLPNPFVWLFALSYFFVCVPAVQLSNVLSPLLLFEASQVSCLVQVQAPDMLQDVTH